MQNVAAATALSALDLTVLQSVVYSDLFDFPVTPEEVWRWLPVPATLLEVEAALSRSPFLVTREPYVMLEGRAGLAEVREQRSRTSAVLRRQADSYGHWIARLPFVRMVAITGSVAVDNAGGDADFDYLVVTAPGRVWLTRTMIMALVRIAGARGVTLCPNYLIGEDALELADREFYTARELLQMHPVTGHEVYRHMLTVNGWWREFLPNMAPSEMPQTRSKPSSWRRAVETLLGTTPFDWAERWILAHKGAELRAQAATSEAVFDATMCKGHFEGWREQTRRAVAERMMRLLEQRP